MKQLMYMDNLPPPSSQLEAAGSAAAGMNRNGGFPVFFFTVFPCKNFDELRELQPPLQIADFRR